MYRSRGIIYNCFLCEQNPLKMGSAHSTSVHSSPAEDLPCSNIWVIFFLRLFNHFRWRKQWQHTPVLLPEKSHGRRSLVGCSPWGLKESDRTEWLHFHFHALEKEMATHSSVLAWRIPGMAESGGLLSMGSRRVRHNWSDLAAAAAATILVEMRGWG